MLASKRPFLLHRALSCWLIAIVFLLATDADAQNASITQVTQVQVHGQTLSGRPFDLRELQGKVVMLMFWSTSCAVCRDKMEELRLNIEGWKDQPFELVMVSLDRSKQDVLHYEELVSQIRPKQRKFIQLWRGEAAYQDNIDKIDTLPSTLLIDKTGKVVKRYFGRIPFEAWNDIADVL